MIVAVVQHFKESRIHAKMASHASNNTLSPTSTKRTFGHLVSTLKEERSHLRRNVVAGYLGILTLYGILIVVLIVEEEKKWDVVSVSELS